MNAQRTVRVYRGLLRLYPRRFRDEYGPDMALLFAHQLRDEPAARVWLRAAVDLAITAPTTHLEAHMNRPATSWVRMLFATISVAGLLFAVLGGSNVAMLTVGVAVAVVAGALAVAAGRQIRPVTVVRPVTAQWWRFLAGGAVVLVAVIAATSAPVEFDDALWWPMVITVLAAVVALGAGLVLGVAHLAVSRRRHAAS